LKIAIIGAGGHVGIPFSLVCAQSGLYDVVGFDIDEDRVIQLNNGEMPFYEEDGEELLKKCVGKSLYFTTAIGDIADADIFVVMVGTPVDEEGNPRLDDLLEVARTLGRTVSKENVSVILRSTVSPGTTRVFKDELEAIASLRSDGIFSFDVYYIPERVLQGKGIEETTKHLWMVGTKNAVGVNADIAKFIRVLGVGYRLMKWEEAEIGKLMTNMYRYVNFAFANEMQIIGDNHKVDIHKVIISFNDGYERLNVPLPGPNVGGPCLFKDGKFLTADIPFPELIQTAFNINEGMPQYVLNKVIEAHPETVETVLILGASFKANSDDTRNSLSFKLKKCCERKGIVVDIYDPHVITYSNIPDDMYDAIIVMTPHSEFYKESWSAFMDKWNEKFVWYDMWTNNIKVFN
jgi:UDP-N-acetyl-D-mannosaminuronic acid dehydrogenase